MSIELREVSEVMRFLTTAATVAGSSAAFAAFGWAMSGRDKNTACNFAGFGAGVGFFVALGKSIGGLQVTLQLSNLGAR